MPLHTQKLFCCFYAPGAGGGMLVWEEVCQSRYWRVCHSRGDLEKMSV